MDKMFPDDSDAHQASIELVRANRAQFLGAREPDLRELASLLVTDALVLGANEVCVSIYEDWHVVHSAFDWLLAESRLNEIESFRRIQIFHKHRKNSNRSNILITAFSKDVFTVSATGQVVKIKGKDFEPEVVLNGLGEIVKARRAVLFRNLFR